VKDEQVAQFKVLSRHSLGVTKGKLVKGSGRIRLTATPTCGITH